MVLKAAVAVTMLVLLPHGVTFPSGAWAPALAACLTGQRHTRDKYSVGMCSPDGKVRPDANDGSGQRSRVAPTDTRMTRGAGSTTLLQHFLQKIEDAAKAHAETEERFEEERNQLRLDKEEFIYCYKIVRLASTLLRPFILTIISTKKRQI